MRQVSMSAAEFRRRRCGAKLPATGGKYHVAPKEDRTADGIVFASRKEMERYLELVQLRQAGAVAFFLRQVPFHLPGNTRWVADFLVVWQDAHRLECKVTVEDVKGFRTQIYKLKKRQVESLYPIKIREL